MNTDYTMHAVLVRINTIREILQEVDYTSYFRGIAHQKLEAVLEAENFLLGNDSLKEKFFKELEFLSDICGCVVFDSDAALVLAEITYFQEIRTRLILLDGARSDAQEYRNIFEAAGVERPEIPVLSEKFLKEVRRMKRQNIALELLKKILQDEIKIFKSHDLILSRKFTHILNGVLKRHAGNLINTTLAVEGLMYIANRLREATEIAQSEEDGWSVHESEAHNYAGMLKIAPVVYDRDMIESEEMKIEEQVRRTLKQDFLDYIVAVENSLEQAERYAVDGDMRMIPILEGLFSVNQEIVFHAQNANEDLPPVDYGMKVSRIVNKYFTPVLGKDIDRIETGVAQDGQNTYWNSELENISRIVEFFKQKFLELNVSVLEQRINAIRA